MKKIVINIIKLLIGIALIIYILRFVNMPELIETVRRANYFYVLLGVAFYTVSIIVVDAIRNFVLIKKYNFSFSQVIHMLLVSIFINNIFLGGFGGDGYRSVIIKRKAPNWGTSIYLVLIDKISVLVATSLIVLFYLMFFGENLLSLMELYLEKIKFDIGKSKILWITGAGVMLLAAVVFLLRSKFPAFFNKVKSFMTDTREAIKKVQKKTYLLLVFYTTLGITFRVCSFYFFIKCFHDTIFFPDLFIMFCFLLVILYVPVTFGSLGVREGAIILCLTFYGVEETNAVAVAFFTRILQYVYAIAGGILFMQNHKSKRVTLELQSEK